MKRASIMQRRIAFILSFVLIVTNMCLSPHSTAFADETSNLTTEDQQYEEDPFPSGEEEASETPESPAETEVVIGSSKADNSFNPLSMTLYSPAEKDIEIPSGQNQTFTLKYSEGAASGSLYNLKLTIQIPGVLVEGTNFEANLLKNFEKEDTITKANMKDSNSFSFAKVEETGDYELVLSLKDVIQTGHAYSFSFDASFLPEVTTHGTEANFSAIFSADLVGSEKDKDNNNQDGPYQANIDFSITATTQNTYSLTKTNIGTSFVKSYTYDDGTNNITAKAYKISYKIDSTRDKAENDLGTIGLAYANFTDTLPKNTAGEYPIGIEIQGIEDGLLQYEPGDSTFSFRLDNTNNKYFGFVDAINGRNYKLITPILIDVYYAYDTFKPALGEIDASFEYENTITMDGKDNSEQTIQQTGSDTLVVTTSPNEAPKADMKKVAIDADNKHNAAEFATGTDFVYGIKFQSTATDILDVTINDTLTSVFVAADSGGYTNISDKFNHYITKLELPAKGQNFESAVITFFRGEDDTTGTNETWPDGTTPTELDAPTGTTHFKVQITELVKGSAYYPNDLNDKTSNNLIKVTVNVVKKTDDIIEYTKAYRIHNNAELIYSSKGVPVTVSSEAKILVKASTVGGEFVKSSAISAIPLSDFSGTENGKSYSYLLTVTNPGALPITGTVKDLGVKFYKGDTANVKNELSQDVSTNPQYSITNMTVKSKTDGSSGTIVTSSGKTGEATVSVEPGGTVVFEVIVNIKNPGSLYIKTIKNFSEFEETGNKKHTSEVSHDVSSTPKIKVTKTVDQEKIPLITNTEEEGSFKGLYSPDGEILKYSITIKNDNTGTNPSTVTLDEITLTDLLPKVLTDDTNNKAKVRFVNFKVTGMDTNVSGKYNASASAPNDASLTDIVTGTEHALSSDLYVKLSNLRPGQSVTLSVTVKIDTLKDGTDNYIAVTDMNDPITNTANVAGIVKKGFKGSVETEESQTVTDNATAKTAIDKVMTYKLTKQAMKANYADGTSESNSFAAININKLASVEYGINAFIQTNIGLENVTITDLGSAFVDANGEMDLSVTYAHSWITEITLPDKLMESHTLTSVSKTTYENNKLNKASTAVNLYIKEVPSNLTGVTKASMDALPWIPYASAATPDIPIDLRSNYTANNKKFVFDNNSLVGTTFEDVEKVAQFQLVITNLPANTASTAAMAQQYGFNGFNVKVVTKDMLAPELSGLKTINNNAAISYEMYNGTGTVPGIVDISKGIITINRPTPAAAHTKTRTSAASQAYTTFLADTKPTFTYDLTASTQDTPLPKLVLVDSRIKQILSQKTTSQGATEEAIDYYLESVQFSNINLENANAKVTIYTFTDPIDKTNIIGLYADPTLGGTAKETIDITTTAGLTNALTDKLGLANKIKAIVIVYAPITTGTELPAGFSPKAALSYKYNSGLSVDAWRIRNYSTLLWSKNETITAIDRDAETSITKTFDFGITKTTTLPASKSINLKDLLTSSTGEAFSFNIKTKNSSSIPVKYTLTDGISNMKFTVLGKTDPVTATNTDIKLTQLTLPASTTFTGGAPVVKLDGIVVAADAAITDNLVYTKTDGFSSFTVEFPNIPSSAEYTVKLDGTILARKYTDAFVSKLTNTASSTITYNQVSDGKSFTSAAKESSDIINFATDGIAITKLTKEVTPAAVSLATLQNKGSADVTYTITAGHDETSSAALQNFKLEDTQVDLKYGDTVKWSSYGTNPQLTPDLFQITSIKIPAFLTTGIFLRLTPYVYDEATKTIIAGSNIVKWSGTTLLEITADSSVPIMGFVLEATDSNYELTGTISSLPENAALTATVTATIGEPPVSAENPEIVDYFTHVINTATLTHKIGDQTIPTTDDAKVSITGINPPVVGITKTAPATSFDANNFYKEDEDSRIMTYTIKNINNSAEGADGLDYIEIKDTQLLYMLKGAATPNDGKLTYDGIKIILEPSDQGYPNNPFKTFLMDKSGTAKIAELTLISGGSVTVNFNDYALEYPDLEKDGFTLRFEGVPANFDASVDVSIKVAQVELGDFITFDGIKNIADISWKFGSTIKNDSVNVIYHVAYKELILGIAKTINDTTIEAGNKANWQIIVWNATDTVTYYNPFVFDVLPEGMVNKKSDANFAITYETGKVTGNDPQTFTQTPADITGLDVQEDITVTIAGGKRQTIPLQFSGKLNPGEAIKINIPTLVSISTLPGEITNNAYVTSRYQKVVTTGSGFANNITLPSVVGAGNGIHPGSLSMEDVYEAFGPQGFFKADAKIKVTMAVSFLIHEEVSGSLDNGAWSFEPSNGYTTPGGTGTYRYTIHNNDKAISYNNIYVLSKLPYIGDTAITNTQPLHSQWAPVFNSFDATILYDTTADGNLIGSGTKVKPTIYVTTKDKIGDINVEALKNGQFTPGTVWTEYTEYIATGNPNAAIAAFVLDFKTAEDDNGQEYNLELKKNQVLQFKVLVDAPVSDSTREDAVAWNNFAVFYNPANDTSGTKSDYLETNKVGLAFNRGSNGILSVSKEVLTPGEVPEVNEDCTEVFKFKLLGPDGWTDGFVGGAKKPISIITAPENPDFEVTVLTGREIEFSLTGGSKVTFNGLLSGSYILEEDNSTGNYISKLYVLPDEETEKDTAVITGENPVSEFKAVNQQINAGQINIKKEILPVTGSDKDSDLSTDFAFELDNGKGFRQEFTLKQGENISYTNVPAGTYTLTEKNVNQSDSIFALAKVTPDSVIVVDNVATFELKVDEETELLDGIAIVVSNKRIEEGKLEVQKVLVDTNQVIVSDWGTLAFEINITGKYTGITRSVTLTNSMKSFVFQDLPYDEYTVSETPIGNYSVTVSQPVVTVSPLGEEARVAISVVTNYMPNDGDDDPTPPTTTPSGPSGSGPSGGTTYVPSQEIPSTYVRFDDEGSPLGLFVPQVNDEGEPEWVKLEDETPLGTIKVNPVTGAPASFISIICLAIMGTTAILEAISQFKKRKVTVKRGTR